MEELPHKWFVLWASYWKYLGAYPSYNDVHLEMMQENHLRTLENTIQLVIVSLCPDAGLIGGHLDQSNPV